LTLKSIQKEISFWGTLIEGLRKLTSFDVTFAISATIAINIANLFIVSSESGEL